MIDAVKQMIYKSSEKYTKDGLVVLSDPDVEGFILASRGDNDDEWMSSPDSVRLDDMT